MKNYILNTPSIVELLSKNKIVVVDGGARGELFRPFNLVNKKIIKVLRFEPDSDATFTQNVDADELIIPKALWSKSGKIDINIAVEPSTSSVYPFNIALQEKIDPFINIRKTKQVVSVESISLDEFIDLNKNLKIDFIKLDIHGAEYEVLEGAKNVLETNLGLLIESWVLPIHKGQKTRAHVESLAYENKYYVFEEFHRSLWARNSSKFVKRQLVALDTLFFKDPILDNNIVDEIEAIKIIGLANLFEHNAYALQLCEDFYSKKILNKKFYELFSKHLNQHCRPTIKEKVLLKLQSLIRRLSYSAFK